MNESTIGIILLVASLAAVAWIGVAAFRNSTLSAKIGTGEGVRVPGRDLVAGTEAVVSKTLRPVGTIELGAVPYDATSEGEFIEAGAKVVVIGISGNSVLVRRKKQI